MLLLSGIILKAIILSAMFLYALVFLKEGIEKSGYAGTSDNDIEDQTRDLQIETEHLARKRKVNVSYHPLNGIVLTTHSKILFFLLDHHRSEASRNGQLTRLCDGGSARDSRLLQGCVR
jgi:hypothetical protein